MAEKRLLIADADAGVWDEFRQALGPSWVVVGAVSCSEALADAVKKPFNVVVANHDLPEWGGPELLNRLRVDNPKALRFIAAVPSLKEKVMCSVLGGDQFLPLPFDRAGIKLAIERSVAADYGMTNSVRELVGRIRTFPTIPSLYLEVVKALQDPNATTADIGAIIAKDMSMTTKLVQVINSAYFGLPRNITDPTEAVGILGFETVKSLIMAVKLLSQYEKVKPVYFSIDSIWRHSTNVARTARVMALLETNSPDCSGIAYTGGLMHDLGKVILAANFDDQYHGAHTIARKQQAPLWEVEKDIFGATHGEIGAYLLALWGMPPEVVRVAALHHQPSRSEDKTFTALTAVHVANALEYEANPETDGLPAPLLDSAYLQQLGVEDRVELWRFARREPDATKSDTLSRSKLQVKAVEKEAPPSPLAEPPPSAPESLPVPAETPFHWGGRWTWISAGLAASVLVAGVIRVKTNHSSATAENLAVAIQPAAEAMPPKAVEVPIAAPAAPVKVAAAAPALPAPAPPKTGLDRLKLEAIFFSSHHPSALINGRLAVVDEEVAECRVLEISRTSVTVEYQHQQRTLTLR